MFRGFLNLESPFMRFLSKIGDFMILNILFLIFSLPIITVGASVTAFYDVLTRMDTKKEVPAASGFVKSFKNNFKQSTIIWLIAFAVMAFLGFDIYLFITKIPGGYNKKFIFMVIYIVILAICFIATGFAFVIQARFENTVKRTIKLAFGMTFLSLIPNGIFTGAASLLPVYLFLQFPNAFFALFPAWFLGGITLIGYVNSKVYMRVLGKYALELKDEENEEDEEFKPLEFLEKAVEVETEESTDVSEKVAEEEING